MAARHQTQISERVFDFGALEESQAAIDAVRGAGLHQLFFKHTRLGVGAIQNGDLRALAAGGLPRLNAVEHETRLIDLVERGVQGNAFSLCAGGPQLLAEPAVVVGDDRVRGLENISGGAVILFEADNFGAGVVFIELENVVDQRAAPAIDGLIVVAHHE